MSFFSKLVSIVEKPVGEALNYALVGRKRENDKMATPPSRQTYDDNYPRYVNMMNRFQQPNSGRFPLNSGNLPDIQIQGGGPQRYEDEPVSYNTLDDILARQRFMSAPRQPLSVRPINLTRPMDQTAFTLRDKYKY